MKKRLIQSYEPATIRIEEGETLSIRVKRLSVQESATFDRLYWRTALSEADRMVLVRRPGEELETRHGSALTSEQYDAAHREVTSLKTLPESEANGKALAALEALVTKLMPTDTFVVSDEEVRRRRLLEMSAAERERYEAMREADVEAYATFLDQVLARFVKVDPEQLDWEDDEHKVRPVLNGAELALCFGARTDVLRQIVREIRLVNEVSADQKKALRSHSDSAPSSSESDPTVTGPSSAPTATPANDTATATTAAVTPTAESPSGATAA